MLAADEVGTPYHGGGSWRGFDQRGERMRATAQSVSYPLPRFAAQDNNGNTTETSREDQGQ